jgi:hypothetical protein
MSRTITALLLTYLLLAGRGSAGWAADQPVPGTKLLLKQTTSASTSFTSKAIGLVAPTPAGSDDPTITGATLLLYNPNSGESATFDLPESNWTINSTGTIFKFTNRFAPSAPSEVRTASIRGGRGIKLRAKAAGITLDEPAQGSIGVVLTSGTTRYCALFGGTIRRDQPGRFQAKGALAPVACPAGPTTTTTSSTSTTSPTTVSTTSTTETTSSSETTTSETTSSTTTSTTLASCPPPAVPLGSISFTINPGSPDCGGVRVTPGPAAPFSGEIDDAMGVKLRDLGVGCLYLGGGNNGALPAAPIPAGGTSVLSVSGASGLALTLAASDGSGPQDCTRGAGPDSHCANGNPGTDSMGACASDADCGGQIGSCLLDANCFFGPPLPVFAGALSTCVFNVIQTDACGSADLVSMNSSLSTLLSSRLYLTGNSESPCPVCDSGTCSAGARAGDGCSGTGPTSECPPLGRHFVGNLPIALNPLTTASTTVTEPSGFFCAGQGSRGAFGRTETRTIRETGVPLGGLPLTATLAGVTCIPATGNGLVDPILGLPGPAGISVSGAVNICLPPLLPCP